MTGTGFIKCIPITWPGRCVTAAIWVMEIEEVLEAKIADEGARRSNSRNSSNLISSFSVAASTTRSAIFTPSARVVKGTIRCKEAALSASVRVPLAI